MKWLLILSCIFVFHNYIFAQEEDDHKVDYFPTERLFPLIDLDPLSCQPYGGIHVLFEKGSKKRGVFIPVNMGFSKPFFRFPVNKQPVEVGLEAASYVQFEVVQVSGNTYLGGLFNNDYKASGYISTEINEYLFRFRLFHISSHLGDDYMIRNEDFSRNDKSVNYEQIDFTTQKAWKYLKLYFGSGYIFTPNAFRERFSLQTGFDYDKNNNRPYHFICGLDIKLFQQNDFYPNLRGVIGTSYNKKAKSMFRLQLEVYHGHLPYSTQEYRKISWIGISSIIQI